LAPLGLFGAMVSASFYMILTGFLHSEAVMDVADAIVSLLSIAWSLS